MESSKLRRAIWSAARQISQQGEGASASAAKELGIEETDSFKTLVKTTHEAGMGAMPARSELCKWMRAEGLLKPVAARKPKDGPKSKPKAGPKSNKRSKENVKVATGDAAVIKRARVILKTTPNLKQFCERAGIPAASAYKWRSGNETLTARSATRIIDAASGSERHARTMKGAAPRRRVVGAAKSAIMSRSKAIDIDADLDLISKARGESKQDAMIRILRNYLQTPQVRKSLEVLRRHASVQEQMEAALAAI